MHATKKKGAMGDQHSRTYMAACKSCALETNF